MKIALDWIAEYLTPTPSAEAAADALMNGGLPVESISPATGAKEPTQVLDVEVTSNRTDCFSHVGLARELAALTAGRFLEPKIQLPEFPAAAATASQLHITVEDHDACPYYSARIIRNIKVGPSPEWLAKRLESIGLRPVNNVVDVTNYVLMELGQPLHAFDLAAIRANHVIIRPAGKNEKLLAIDNKEYALDPSMLVIADETSPLAIAGVMGGKTSEVTDRTTDLLLESARFDPLSIRTTSRALGLKSDSSYRFERGLDPTLAERASQRAAQLILQIASTPKTEIAPLPIAIGNAAAAQRSVCMRFKRFTQITGMRVAPERALAILTALGFSPWIDDEPGESDDRVCTRVPAHRLDVEREIDLIEEVARILGYGHIPTLDRVSHPVTAETSQEKAGRKVLETFTEAGFSEAVSVTFIAQADAKPFLAEGNFLIHPQHAGWKTDVLRPSLLPSLLAVRRTNQNAGILDARVFEKAETFQQGPDAKAAPLRQRLIGAVASDLSALTALLTLLPDRLSGNPALTLTAHPKDFPYFVHGGSAEIQLAITGQSTTPPASPIIVGHVGIFTAEIQRRYDLRTSVAGLELNYDSLLALFTPIRRAVPVPRFPAIKRDLSIVLDESIRWADVKTALEKLHLPALEGVHFVTTFRHKDLGPDKKSLTLALDFRDPARTLKSEEVDAQVAAALSMLTQSFRAALRA